MPRRLILDYLIPLLLVRGVFPSPKLLARSARHKTLYEPFVRAVRSGDFAAYERQLEVAQKRLMARGTYLVVERAREGAVRGLLKKACVPRLPFPARTAQSTDVPCPRRSWVLEGKPARMSIERFRSYYNAAQALGLEEDVRLGRVRRDEVERRKKGGEIDGEEMECLLANMIYKVRREPKKPFLARAEAQADAWCCAGFAQGLHLARASTRRPVQGQALPLVRGRPLFPPLGARADASAHAQVSTVPQQGRGVHAREGREGDEGEAEGRGAGGGGSGGGDCDGTIVALAASSALRRVLERGDSDRERELLEPPGAPSQLSLISRASSFPLSSATDPPSSHQQKRPGFFMASLPPLRGASSRSSTPAPAPPAASSSATAAGAGVLPGEGDLWSNILDSVKGSRTTLSKPCFVLGASLVSGRRDPPPTR